MNILKQHGFSILLCLFELQIGILLLIDPMGFTSGIMIAVGVLLIAVGIWLVVRYFQTNALEAALGRKLTAGLAALILGLFLVFRSAWFVKTFSVLTLVYGLTILVTGLIKTQQTVDSIRLKSRGWWIDAATAVLAIAGALVIICNPFETTTILWRFIGITLLVEAVADGVALLSRSRSEW